jgi:hypothetical protein
LDVEPTGDVFLIRRWSLTHYLDEESARRFSSARGRRDELVTSVVGLYFNLVIAGLFTFVLGMVAFVALTMRSRHLAAAYGYGLMGDSCSCCHHLDAAPEA